jgi:2-C-methyl-D-erythritol 4-phosphate cytidylyltransferase
MKALSVIITAGGIGKRMGGDLPKQFIVAAGKPILIHTLERIHAFEPNAQLILTLPADWGSYWNELLLKYACKVPHEIVEGGVERYHSVKNAISHCRGEIIAIHDGVRPLLSEETFNRLRENIETHEAVIPVIPVKESIRSIEGLHSCSVNRSNYKLVQTPQFFNRLVLEKAYSLAFHSGITDDASLAEESGCLIYLVDGNEENIKITTPFDLKIAQALLMTEK